MSDEDEDRRQVLFIFTAEPMPVGVARDLMLRMQKMILAAGVHLRRATAANFELPPSRTEIEFLKVFLSLAPVEEVTKLGELSVPAGTTSVTIEEHEVQLSEIGDEDEGDPRMN